MTLRVDGTTVEIPLMDHLQSIEAEVSETAGGTMKVTLFDPNQDEIEDLLLGLRSDSAAAVGTPDKNINGKYVEIQFGWDNGDIAGLPRWTGIVTGYTPTYEPQGTTLEFDTVSQGIVGAVLDRKPRSFPAGLRASDMIAQIAASNNWTAVIEESAGVLDAVSANTESDVKLIRDKILPRAVNKAKQPFVFYFDFDGLAHFHTPGYRGSDAAGTEIPLDADYLFAQDAMGDVESFAPSDGTLAAQVFGAGNASYAGTDASGGKQLDTKATATANPADASLATVGGGVHRPTIGSRVNARLYVPSRDPVEFEQRVAHRWGQIARNSYTATLKVRGTHAMRVGGWVRVRRLRRDGREHHLSGIFLVTKLRHSFGNGWSTEVDLVRTGTGYVPGVPVGVNVQSKTGVVDSSTQTGQGGEPAGPQESFSEAPVN
jgi:hypothetical protein